MSLTLALGLMLQVGGEPAILGRARVDPRAEVSFHALVRPETVYVGEAVNYELGVFISDGMRQRLRRNPEFVPPELRSVLAYDIRERVRSRMVQIEDRNYEVHVFRRALFPVAPGRIDIPRARLTYTVPLGSSFFSREETRTLQSEAVWFVAIPPPEAGRPATWSGAVGELSLDVAVASRRARVGDPAVVTVRVSGAGNVQLWPRPALALEWANVVNGPERVIIDTLATRVRGTKEFDFLVTPTEEGERFVPAVSYAFFDPTAGRYRTARSQPERIGIDAGELVRLDTAEAGPVSAQGPGLRRWSRPWPDSPDRHWLYWLVAFLSMIPAVSRAARQRIARRMHHGQDPAHGTPIDPRARPADVQRAFKVALERRLAGASMHWADAREIRRVLRHRGVTDATVARVMELIAELDRVTYGGATDAVNAAGERAVALYRAVDEEAQRPRAVPARGARRTAALLLMLGPLAAYAQDDARPRFNAGVAAHAAGDLVTAGNEFFAAARRSPRAASAWVNAGASAWAVADTALAVVAWQRALRLNPLDRETRNRLARVGADAGSADSAVWPLPRRALAWLAILIWVTAWLQLARGDRSRLARVGVVVGALIGGLSYAHGRRLHDPSLAVTGRSVALKALPALGAESGPAPLTGEIVHVLERSGVWVHIEAPDGRVGWMDGAHVLGLDGRPLRD